MYSPHNPASVPDARGVKQKITKKLASSLRALQVRYVTTDDMITSDDNDANGLCVALEAIFIHGLKVKFIKTQTERRRNKGRHVPLPQPAYWPLLKAITHGNVITQLESVSYINTDVGRCRSWLRQALNECLMECYFITLQREKSRLLEYYQPFALMLDAEDCDVVLSYLQGLSSLTFSLSYKSSILNEWTASPLSLSGLWLDDTERVIQYEPCRRKSLDSVSQSSGSDDTNTSNFSDTKRKLEESSLSLDISSSSSQLSSSPGSDEQPQNRGSSVPILSESSVVSPPVTDTANTVESTKYHAGDVDVGISPPPDTTASSSRPHTPVMEDLKSYIKFVDLAEELPTDPAYQAPGECVAAPNEPASNLNCAPDTLTAQTHTVHSVSHSETARTPDDCPGAELPKSRSWISEEDFHRPDSAITVDQAQPVHLVPALSSESATVHSQALKQPAKAFNVVHRRQIGLSNPFRGLLMLGTLERKHTLGLYKPYYCELTPYEFRLQVEGDEQNGAESCSLLRCESVGPAHNDGRFELQFPGKRLYLRAPSGDEAQDWVDRIQEAVQKFRLQNDESWEIIQYPDSPKGHGENNNLAQCKEPSSSNGSTYVCQVFDWVSDLELEPDALKETVLYMKIHKKWTRFIFSLSERALKCFLPKNSEKALYNTYSAELVKDILPDSSLGSPCCFRLVTTKGSLQLQAESTDEAKAWRELVRAAYLESEDSALIPMVGDFQIKSHVKEHLLFKYLLYIPTEHGLDMQNVKCAGCHQQLGFQFCKAKVCSYSGLYYCGLCHQDEISIIPSRIVHNWDLTERVVSRQALNFLQMVQNEPIFNMKRLNESLYQHTQTMYEISHKREKLRLLGEYLMTCRSGALRELSAMLDQRNYLLECTHTYSVRDLKQISDGVFESLLQSVLEFASSHVFQCDLCSQKGFVCLICNCDDIIYPFQFDTTTRCGDCKAVFHRPCKIASRPCPRCLQRKKCQDQRVKK
ncbi:pleckstrin homology domain-containing family M member 1 isoform X2 [Pseudophryne corroboree]|uniref:pleckstrin homology domain-containing family M member 1 isoform X2 n=1 Tax=Pseudophryne corroboree TaxID=495146 RepID=UPI00308156A4